MNPKIVFKDEFVCVSQWHNLQLAELRGAMVVAHVAELDASYRSLIAAHPEGIGSLMVVAAGTPLSESEVSNKSAVMMKGLGKGLRQVEVVLEGTGVWASAVRTLLRGINVLMRQPYAMHVQENVAGGAVALLALARETAGPNISAKDIADATNQMRQAYLAEYGAPTGPRKQKKSA